MTLELLRAVAAFFLFTYTSMFYFSRYQDADENALSSKSAILFGLLAAAASVHPPVFSVKNLLNKRFYPPYMEYVFSYFVSGIFVLFLVFTNEPAYGIIVIAMTLQVAADNSRFLSRQSFVLVTVLLTIAALFYFDNSNTSHTIADSVRDLYGFDLADAGEFEGSYLTGEDTVVANPVLTALVVMVSCGAILFYTKSMQPPSSVEEALDPEKNGIENLNRFITEVKTS